MKKALNLFGSPTVFFSAMAIFFVVGLVLGRYEICVMSLFLPMAIPASASLYAVGPELLRRQFVTEIQPLLFPSMSFIERSVNDDAFVNSNTVELPHSGAIPGVQVDRVVLPAPIAKRTDVPTSYQLEELTTDPSLIGYTEALIISYNKRASILQQHADTINTKAATRCLQKWAAGANTAHKVPTTGAVRPAGNSNGTQTGTRKGAILADIANVQSLFFKDDVQNELADIQGVAVITPSMYNDLIKLPEFNQVQTYGSANIPSGVVRRAFGFDFYIRSLVTVLDNTDTLKAEGAAGAATDQDAGVFYSPKYVRKAKSAIKIFVDEDKPEYYGSVFSTLLRFGAIQSRNDSKGVVLLFEDN